MREHRLRMSEGRVLRRIFGPKRENITEGQRRIFAIRSFKIVLFTN
jgi:hypothetical protein